MYLKYIIELLITSFYNFAQRYGGFPCLRGECWKGGTILHEIEN